MGTWSAKTGGGPPDCNGQDGGTVIGLVFLENGRHRTTRRQTNVASLARLIVRAGCRLAPLFPFPAREAGIPGFAFMRIELKFDFLFGLLRS